MFRKTMLALAALGTIAIGGTAIAPSQAEAGRLSVTIGIGDGYYAPVQYRPYRHRYGKRFRHYRPVREVCTVKRIKRYDRYGRPVFKRVETCRPAYRGRYYY